MDAKTQERDARHIWNAWARDTAFRLGRAYASVKWGHACVNCGKVHAQYVLDVNFMNDAERCLPPDGDVTYAHTFVE